MIEGSFHAGWRTLVVGDMRSMRLNSVGKVLMTMQSQPGDVQLKLLDLEYVPGVKFNMFSLHGVVSECPVSLEPDGVRMLD